MKLRFLLPALLVAAGAAYAQAPSTFDDCDRFVLRHPDQEQGYRCYVALASRRNGWDEAARHLEGLTSVDPDNFLARLTLASVEARRGGPRAESLYLESIAAFRARREPDHEVAARLGYATFLSFRSRIAESGEQRQEAMNTAVQTGDAVLAATVSVHLARTEYYQARYEAAEQRLLKVRETLFREGDAYQQSLWLGVAGSVRWGMGRFPEALQDFQDQARLLAELNDPFEEAVARSNVALLAARLNPQPYTDSSRRRVTGLIEHARDSAIQGGNRGVEGKSELYLGQIVPGIEARRIHLERGLLICEAIGDLENAALASRLLAESLVMDAPMDPDRGLAVLDKAVAIAASLNSPQTTARTRIIQATLQWELLRQGDDRRAGREEAVRLSLAALDAIEAIRDSQSGGTVRARTFSPWAFFYTQFIGNLLQPPEGSPTPDDMDLAFRISERMRARVFLDELDAADAAREPDDLPWRQVPELQQVQARLEQNEAVLSFLAGDLKAKGYFIGGSWLTVITQDGVELYPLPPAEDLSALVDLALGSIRNRDGSEQAGLVRLRRDLLETALADLPETADHLIIVPDGPLHRLPFGALVDDRYRISQTPSVAAWLHWTGEEEVPAGRPATAWIDPVTGNGEAVSERSAPLGRLPYAALEGRAIREHLGSGVQARAGASATEHRFKQTALNEFAIVHLAAHGLVDDLHPDLSGIALTPGDGEDGLLQVREIVNLDLTGRVVVLSACRSASGGILEGEGVLSLARAFFVAGAQAVVANLWPVRDDESAAFSAGLYRHLGEGKDLATALAETRRDRVAAGDPTEAWAGTVLIGNGRLAPIDPRDRHTPWSWLHLGLIAAILAVIAGFRGWKLQRR